MIMFIRLYRLLTLIALAASFLTLVPSAQAQEAPDVLVKRISQGILDTIKSDKELQSGNYRRVQELVESQILPYVDFERTTSLAVGRFWREATPEQRSQLTTEFRSLLVHTYSGALSQVRDQKIEFKPLRAAPADNEVEVRSQVVQSRGETIQMNYRLIRTASGWKIYDVNILGAWLIETYKGNFATEIARSGIDGLIRTLAERNRKLAGSSMRTTKSAG